MICTALSLGAFTVLSFGHIDDSVTFSNFEVLPGGYVAATTFVKASAPGLVDGWYLASGTCGSADARVTPDPIPPLLGGSGTLGLLGGLQSAALDLDGSYVAKRFSPGTPYGPGFTVRFLTQVKSGLLLNPVNGGESAELVFSDDLDTVSRRAGVRFNTSSHSSYGTFGSIEILTSGGVWVDTGVCLPNHHLLQLEMVLYPDCDQYRVFVSDIYFDPCTRVDLGIYSSNGPLQDDSAKCVAKGGLMLTSRNGTALFDDIRVAPGPDGFFAGYGNACKGSVANAPTIGGIGAPGAGYDTGFRIADAPAGAVMLLFVGLNPASIPAGKCSLLVGFPLVLSCVPLPAITANGMLTIKTSVPPSTPDVDLYIQAFGVTEDGKPYGTSGLRMAIR